MSSMVALTLKEIITDNSKTYTIDDIKSILEIDNDIILMDFLLCLLKKELNKIDYETIISDQLIIDNIYYYIFAFIVDDRDCDIEKVLLELKNIQHFIDKNNSKRSLEVKKQPKKIMKQEKSFWSSLSAYNSELINNVILKNLNIGRDQKYNLVEDMIFNIKNIHLLKRMKDTIPCLFLERNTEGTTIFSKSFNFYLELLADENAKLSDIIYFDKVINLFYEMEKIKKSSKVINEIVLAINRIKYNKRMNNQTKKQRVDTLMCLKNKLLNKQSYTKNIHIPSIGSEEFEAYLEGTPNNYHDFTNKAIYTIDVASSVGLDDAISLEKLNNNNYLLGFYITDVSSSLNVNLCNDINILHYSNTICSKNHEIFYDCSLLPGDFKKTIAYYFEIEPDGNIKRYFFTKGIIKIKDSSRLSFDEADNILKSGCNNKIMFETLSDLNQISNLIEVGNITNDNNTSKKQINSDKMICKFSILANHIAASHAKKTGVPFLYKNQQKIDLDTVLKDHSILNNLFCNFDNSLEKNNLDYIIINSFSKSYYSTIPQPHEDLGLDVYSQTTSPLRRYADLENQRLINLFFINKIMDDKIFYENEERLNKISELLNVGTIIPKQCLKEDSYSYTKCL